MSKNNRVDIIGDGEERSVEGSEMGASTQDFFLDDENFEDAGPPAQNSNILADQSTGESPGVSIFNTLASAKVDRDRLRIQDEEKRGAGSTPFLQSILSRRDLGRGDPAMIRGELELSDSAPATIVTAAMDSQKEKTRELPPDGQMTKADGLADQARGRAGEMTQNLLATMTAGAPSGREGQGVETNGHESGVSLMKKPPKSARPKERGGVAMMWESNVDDGDEKELSLKTTKDQWGAEGARLEKAADQVTEDLESALLSAESAARDRTVHFEQGDERGLAATREWMSEEYRNEGNIIPMLLLDAEDWGALKMSANDLAAGLAASMQGDWELCRLSKKTEFEHEEVLELMRKVSELLPKWGGGLAETVGEDQVITFKKRHQVLSQGLLSGRGVTREAAKLFPQESAGDIMEWYIRLVTALLELERLHESMKSGLAQLGPFLEKYPGPKLDAKAAGTEERKSLLRLPLESKRRAGSALSVSSRAPSSARENRYSSAQPAMARDQRDWGARTTVPPQPTGPFFSTMDNRTPRELGASYVIPKRGVDHESGEKGEAASGTSVEESSELMSIPGFSGMFRQDVVDEVTEYVTQKLTESGNVSTLTIDTIVKHLPKLGLYTRKGHEQSATQYFTRAAKDITPYSEGAFISVPEWWRMLNELLDDRGWSLAVRVRFLGRTGGLAAKVNDSCLTRVKDLIRNSSSWLPDYDAQRPEEDNRYWLYIWIDVGLKLIQEFHSVQKSEVIEEGLKVLFKDKKYAFTSQADPLNRDFYRVCLLYQDMNVWLVERSSDLVNSPIYVWKLLKKWLKEQGVAGSVMVSYVEKALAKLAIDPASVLPAFPKMSDAKLLEIRHQGSGHATRETYQMILEQLKARATQEDLQYQVSSLSQINEMYQEAQKKSDKPKSEVAEKKQRKANSTVVTTDYSTLTVNSVATEKGGDKSKQRAPMCGQCKLYHWPTDEVCPFWDPEKKQFKIKNFLNFSTVRKIEKDGSSTVNEFWIQKLKHFGFKGMGITREQDQKKILKDLKTAAEQWPTASIEERNKYAEKRKLMTQLTTLGEEQQGGQDMLVNQVGAWTTVVGKAESKRKAKATSAKKKKKSSKKKEQKKKGSGKGDSDSEPSSDDSSSGPDVITDSDSEYSVDEN